MMRRALENEFVRFLVAGAVNTGTTYVIYAVLLLALPYALAYSIAYVSGIFISYYLNSRFVFNAPLHWRKAVQFPLVYLVQYVLGVGLLAFWVGVIGVPEIFGPALVIVFTIPATFLLSRLIIKPS